MKSRAELEAMARRIRLNIAKMTWQSGIKGAHLGGSMSVTDILAVLYGEDALSCCLGCCHGGDVRNMLPYS